MPSSKLFFLVVVLVLLGLFAKSRWLKIAFIGLAGALALLAAMGALG